MKRSFILIALMGLAGCRGEVKTEKVTNPVAEKTYPLVGVVRKVDAGEGKVTIRHEEIPGFMPAMTMRFTVKDRSELEDVREGDKVTATLRIAGDTSELRELLVTEPAPAPAMVLDLSKGEASLKSAPRRLSVGDIVPDFDVTTQDGKTLHLNDLRGDVVILTFIYTRCPLPEFCPAQDLKFAALAQLISASPERAKKVRLLSISFDPEHDTPETLAAHARLKGAKPPLWQFAVASHENLQKVAPGLGLVYGPRASEVVHNLSMAVIDGNGKLARLEVDTPWTAEDVFKTVVTVLRQ